MRTSLIALVLALASSGASAATLRPAVTVDGASVSLADVLVDAVAAPGTDLATVMVGAAPAPGRRSTLSGDQVADLARTNGVTIDGLVPRTVAVTRSSHAVPQSELQASLADALMEAGAEPQDVRQIQISAGDRQALQVPLDVQPVAHVQSVDWDGQTGRFTAQVTLPGIEQPVAVNGRTIRVASVPMLRAAVGTGQVISDADLDFTEVPAYRVSRTALVDAGLIVGQQARRPLRAGVALTASDLRRPVVVEKGTLVTMVVQTPAMTLTATGKTLDEGGQGDLIRIVNPTSNKIVQGKVVAADRVTVITAASLVP
jgi:flagella basal body P-ring formation protein FlgA